MINGVNLQRTRNEEISDRGVSPGIEKGWLDLKGEKQLGTKQYGDVIREEQGSAIIEFLLVALPLFIPVLALFLFLNKSATIQAEEELIARQVLAAFTSGSDDEHGFLRANMLINEYSELSRNFANLTYRVNCESRPCLTPGAMVEVTVWSSTNFIEPGFVEPKHGQARSLRELDGQTGAIEFTATARGFVDKWRG